MKLPATKKLLAGVLAAGFITLQVPATAFAASAAEIDQSVQSGLAYLAANKSPDGKISGFGGETDWATIAVAASGQNPGEFTQGAGQSLVDYMESEILPDGSPAASIARRILALSNAQADSAAFGTAAHNYNLQLACSYNNGQIGKTADINDDFWGVMAIYAINPAQTSIFYEMAKDSLSYFLGHQGSDGGFSYQVGLASDSQSTAAAIVAMQAAAEMGITLDNNELATALADATAYLLSTQKDDGGFGYDNTEFSTSDGISTAWALIALNALSNVDQDVVDGARDWLVNNQGTNNDGGFAFMAFGLTESDTFTTAHAVIALLGATWLPAVQQPQDNTIEVTCPSAEPSESDDPVVVITSASQQPSPSQPEPRDTTPANTGNNQVLAQDVTADASGVPAEETAGDMEVEEVTPISESKGSPIKYIVYAIIALSLIGFGWFLFQPKKG